MPQNNFTPPSHGKSRWLAFDVDHPDARAIVHEQTWVFARSAGATSLSLSTERVEAVCPRPGETDDQAVHRMRRALADIWRKTA